MKHLVFVLFAAVASAQTTRVTAPLTLLPTPGQTGVNIQTGVKDMNLRVTGDALGGTVLSVMNRAGVSGLLLKNLNGDLAELVFEGPTGTNRTIRLENRVGSGFTYLDTLPEFQMGGFNSYPTNIGFLFNNSGAGVNRGKYFRFLGGTSGFVGLVAPSTVTSYTLTLPTENGAVGECLKLIGSTQLGFDPCGGAGSSDLLLPVTMWSGSIGTGDPKIAFGSLSGNAFIEVRNSSGVSAAQLKTRLGGSSLELSDTSDDGDAILSTGNTKGAVLELFQRDRSWAGATLEAGAFNDDVGSLKLYSHTSPETSTKLRTEIDNRIRMYSYGGALGTQTAVELNVNGVLGGVLILRSGQTGAQIARINDSAYWWGNAAGLTTTINVTCSGGGAGTITISGGIVTNHTCP